MYDIIPQIFDVPSDQPVLTIDARVADRKFAKGTLGGFG